MLRTEALARHLEAVAAGRRSRALALRWLPGTPPVAPSACRSTNCSAGCHCDRLPVTWALGASPLTVVVEEAGRCWPKGRHSSFKLKMGALPPEEDVARVTRRSPRRCRGDGLARGRPQRGLGRIHRPLLVARARGRWVHLVEQPLPAADIAGMARLRQRSRSRDHGR